MSTDQIEQDPDATAAQSVADRPRRPRVFLAVGVLVIALLGVGGLRWWHYVSTHATTDDAQVTGNIHPVSSRISGTVVSVDVTDNQRVKAGQSLVELDPKDYQAAADQAQAALETAQSQAQAAQDTISLTTQSTQADNSEAQSSVEMAIASIANVQSTVSQAEAAIASAEDAQSKAAVQAANAKLNRDRDEKLYQRGAITEQQRDDARTNYQVLQDQVRALQQEVINAKALYQSALDSVSEARFSLVGSQGKIEQAKANGQQTQVSRQQYQSAETQIAAADAALKQAQLNLSYTSITAPVEGTVGAKTVQVGQEVQPDQPLLSIVGDVKWVLANFNEAQIRTLRPGQAVDIHLDAFPNITFKGRVDSISPASSSDVSVLPPDNATDNFTKGVQRIPVKIVFDPNSIIGYENRITAGMSAEVSVDVQ